MLTIQIKGKEDGVLPVAEIEDIYSRNQYRVDKNIDDFTEMLSFINIDIDNIKKIPYGPYWDFLDEVANNIDSGRWTMHPYMWITYIKNANYLPMPEQAVNQRCDALRNRCIKILDAHGYPINGMCNRYLLLIWARHNNSFQDILSVIRTMVELNKLFSKKE